jgi:hypothetical protein
VIAVKGDIKYGFFVGIGILAAVVAWRLLGKTAGGVVTGASAAL